MAENNTKKNQILQLEQNLSETKFLLDEAQSQIINEKTELSNLETRPWASARKILVHMHEHVCLYIRIHIS